MNRQWSPEIREIGEQIVGLTLKKAKELSDYIREVHGIESFTGGVDFKPPEKEAEKAPEKTEFAVKHTGFDAAKKINLIKVMREITGLGLKEAKDLVEGPARVIRENLSKDEAEALKKKLEEAGGQVTLE